MLISYCIIRYFAVVVLLNRSRQISGILLITVLLIAEL